MNRWIRASTARSPAGPRLETSTVRGVAAVGGHEPNQRCEPARRRAGAGDGELDGAANPGEPPVTHGRLRLFAGFECQSPSAGRAEHVEHQRAIPAHCPLDRPAVEVCDEHASEDSVAGDELDLAGSPSAVGHGGGALPAPGPGGARGRRRRLARVRAHGQR